MAYVISDSCVACGTCQSVCPADAIKEGDIYSIDPDTCLDCGTCADACPTGKQLTTVAAGPLVDQPRSLYI